MDSERHHHHRYYYYNNNLKSDASRHSHINITFILIKFTPITSSFLCKHTCREFA